MGKPCFELTQATEGPTILLKVLMLGGVEGVSVIEFQVPSFEVKKNVNWHLQNAFASVL